MADELLRTAPPSASPNPTIANSKKAPPQTCATRGVTVVAPSHGVPSRAVGGERGGGDDDEAGAGDEWEEERHLDNVLYLVYK